MITDSLEAHSLGKDLAGFLVLVGKVDITETSRSNTLDELWHFESRQLSHRHKPDEHLSFLCFIQLLLGV